jgi:hypothetical protein
MIESRPRGQVRRPAEKIKNCPALDFVDVIAPYGDCLSAELNLELVIGAFRQIFSERFYQLADVARPRFSHFP